MRNSYFKMKELEFSLLSIVLLLLQEFSDGTGISSAETRHFLRYGPQKPTQDSHSNTKNDLTFDSKAVHGAHVPEGLGGVIFPIYQSSTFLFNSAEEGAKCFAGESDGFIYTRYRSVLFV